MTLPSSTSPLLVEFFEIDACRKADLDSPRHIPRLGTETPKSSDLEDLYWFAMELTGDPDFATKLVAKPQYIRRIACRRARKNRDRGCGPCLR
jgi:hypothetical protein